MERVILIFSGALLMAALAFADNPPTADFEEANRLYQEENYREAANLYLSILNGGFESGALHYNLGNAYYKSGQLGRALLHYRKAKRFLPRDRDLEANISLAKMRAADKIEVPRLKIWRTLDSVRDYLTINEWARLTLILFLLTLALIALYFFRGKGLVKKLSFYGATLMLIFFAVCAGFFTAQIWRAEKVIEAVVMEDKIEILSAPDEGAKALFSLHEGTTVEVEQKLLPWVEISLPDGKKGWVRMEVLAEI